MIKRKVDLYGKLVEIVGPERVKVDKLERLLYSHDIAPLPKDVNLVFKMKPDAIVRPRNAMEVSEIVKLACEERIPLVPRGGASWGLAGAVPCMGGIVVDMASMDKILRVDPENMEVAAEAGATWQSVYDAALRKGLLIGSYPSSAPGATLAGWINTAGVGIGSYKYGSANMNIRNMEVVLPEGQIINTGYDLVLDCSSGYNLNGLFVGSEGTLGIITKVTLKAYPAPETFRAISVQYKSLYEAYNLMRAIARDKICPLAISFVDEFHVAYLNKIKKSSTGPGALINVELEGSAKNVNIEEEVIESLIESTGGLRLSDEVAQHEWDERSYEFRVRKIGIGTLPGEIVVPLPKFTKVIEETYELISDMNMEASIIGTLADRNTVAFLPYFFYDEKKVIKTMTSLSFNKKLGDIGYNNGGRPLGLGLFFAPNLSRIKGKEGANLMFNIKTTLDPYDIMNPGKTLEALTRVGAPIPGKAMNLGMDAMAFAKKLAPKEKLFDEKLEEFKESE